MADNLIFGTMISTFSNLIVFFIYLWFLSVRYFNEINFLFLFVGHKYLIHITDCGCFYLMKMFSLCPACIRFTLCLLLVFQVHLALRMEWLLITFMAKLFCVFVVGEGEVEEWGKVGEQGSAGREVKRGERRVNVSSAFESLA